MISTLFPSIDFDRPIQWGSLTMMEWQLLEQWNQETVILSMNFLFIQRILWAPIPHLFFFLCSLVLIFNHIRFIWLLKFIASFCMEASFLLLIIFHSLSPFLFFQQGSLHLLHAIIIFEPICLASIQIYCDVYVDFNRILWYLVLTRAIVSFD